MSKSINIVLPVIPAHGKLDMLNITSDYGATLRQPSSTTPTAFSFMTDRLILRLGSTAGLTDGSYPAKLRMKV